jgi:hypothetical protein
MGKNLDAIPGGSSVLFFHKQLILRPAAHYGDIYFQLNLDTIAAASVE